ncbi:MAG: NADP-specific glutamate dehydrogenase [Bacteroidales bacterium]|nr:NADP-specific glutamate dehydrogenase [Bacteroidales bacterium]MBN2764369.1 NADP-specific glutamate dehydrogenase [Bacteroidales bacterium]
MDFKEVIIKLEKKNPGEKEFLQAAREVLESIQDIYNQNPQFDALSLIDRLLEPERIIIFKVPWQDDSGKINVNRGYHVEYNAALGPYKGGLRFHPNVNLSILKFLAFEQTFKNALTGLPIGGGEGGADFEPKGKSNHEVLRFCQSFMDELYRHIGPETDIPGCDMGVGSREIGYLFGHYRRLVNRFEGVFTGKGTNWGGSWIRKEATGYGLAYIVRKFFEDHNDSIKGKKVLISGAGNVALYAAEKIFHLGGRVITLSDTNGCIFDQNGIDISFVKEIKEMNRGRIKEYLNNYPKTKYSENPGDVWKFRGDIALPCATENELNLEAVQHLLKNGCQIIAEGANMPATPEATEYLLQQKAGFIPAKAANAGGVAVSGLEMIQNSMKMIWSREDIDARLHRIMVNIHDTCVKYGKEKDGYVNYVKGANVAAFLKVAQAMIDQGIM